MRKLSQYFFIALVLLLVSLSNVSKYCRHQLTKWKLHASPVQTVHSAVPATRENTVDSSDYLPLPEVSAAGDFALPEYDATILAHAATVMENAREPLILTWEVLRNVTFKKKYNKEYDQYFDYPVFGKDVQSYAGKAVSISGYIIPLDVGFYALSKNPYSACFFCGGAGPETIMTLVFKNPPNRFKTDAYVTLTGMLQLNDTDVENFMYQLLAAEQTK